MSNNTLIIILELTMALESTVGLELIIHTVHFSLGLVTDALRVFVVATLLGSFGIFKESLLQRRESYFSIFILNLSFSREPLFLS